MSQTEAATQRVTQAIDRLTGALEKVRQRAEAAESRAKEQESGAAALQDALAAERGEKERLAAELSAVAEDRDRLKALTDSVSDRLEQAIGQLEAALEG